MNIKIPGYTTLTGHPRTIVTLMKSALFFDEPETVEDYIESVQRNMWRTQNTGITVTGKTTDEKCESFLHEMAKAGMIEIF